MLSYMVPVEEKPPPAPGKGRLALELVASPGSPESTARKVRSNISKDSSTNSFASDLTISSSTPTGAHDRPKHKLLSNGSKHTSLKRSTRPARPWKEQNTTTHSHRLPLRNNSENPINCLRGISEYSTLGVTEHMHSGIDADVYGP